MEQYTRLDEKEIDNRVWYLIEAEDDLEGWVVSDYVRKI